MVICTFRYFSGLLQKNRLKVYVAMHAENQQKFPRLALVCGESDLRSPNNYFSVLSEPKLLPGDEVQFTEWERRLALLDPDSLAIFVRKAKPLLSVKATSGRDWNQLVEAFNELKGYERAGDLGYKSVRFLEESNQSSADIQAIGPIGTCLVEVKTINKSAMENSPRKNQIGTDGKIVPVGTKGEAGLPLRLTRVLRERYEKARSQLLAHPLAPGSRKICLFIIDLDLRIALKRGNKECLRLFLEGLASDVEIQSISQHWCSDRQSANSVV
jgi:hypothetical protein